MSKTALATFALIGKLKRLTFDEYEVKLAAKLAGQRGTGPAPVLNVAPLPDFNDIYYHPEGLEPDQREREAELARRRSMAARNRNKFGLHGTTGVEPVLRFDPDDYVLSVRAKKNDRSADTQNVAAPPTPKVEGRETSGTRYVINEKELATRPSMAKKR